jgi:hypothetical protein
MTAMRDFTRCIAAGFYRMGIGIGTEKTPVKRRARIGKDRRFSALCKSPTNFCAPHVCLIAYASNQQRRMQPFPSNFLVLPSHKLPLEN